MPRIYILRLSILIISFISSLTTFGQSQKEIEAHKRRWDTPAWSDTLHNPFTGNEAITDTGRAIYNKVCSVCHGMSGKGDGVAAAGLSEKPANHTSEMVQSQADGSLFYELSMGHAPMPAYKDILTAKQRWGLVNYIRVLGKKAPAKTQKK
jgi:cytochrome c